MKLAEIQAGWNRFAEAMEHSGGDLTPEMALELDCLNLAESDKTDGYVFYIKSQEGEIASLKNLEAELAAKRQAAEKRIAWCKTRVRSYMEERQVAELKGAIYKFTLQKAGKPAVELLVEPEELPAVYSRITSVPDKEAIRAALERAAWPTAVGEHPIVRYAKFAEPTVSLRIY